ncbi:uncharacterized protein LOC120074618 isoform X2 [Benincasa hispida]|uniref:uncharacterized protein LOC120074618 isoform X2 n=1 Tax=Benincasa hispida TaxID=102211 RepID=UPI0018FFC8BA|nr:uncharacterized protein LOC120074618 isoform X2 [Benincasa hispida]
MMSHSSMEATSSLEFFKVFLPDSCSLHMSIPPAFMKHLNGTFPEKATIQDHTGKSWGITLEKLDDLLYFKKGWQAFVDYHFLKYGDFLVFQYDGHSTFDVKIFGKNGCKKAVTAKATSSVPILEAEIAEAGNSVSNLEAMVADAGNSISNSEAIVENAGNSVSNLEAMVAYAGNSVSNTVAMVADAAYSVSNLEVVVVDAGNSVPIFKVKKEPVVEEEDVEPSIYRKRKRLQDGSEIVRKSKSIVASNHGRLDNASNSVGQVRPRGPFFERMMKHWSSQTIVKEHLHYMPFFGIENFRIEPFEIIPVRIYPKVAKYIQEYSQFQEHSRAMICSQFHSTSASQEPKYIQFDHEEVDSQQNDQYFQEDYDPQGDNQSGGVDMDMINELPISQSQEILYLEYQPLQTDKEDNRKSANMETTEVGGYSFNIEEQNTESTTELGGNSCDDNEENNMGTTELGGNSFDIEENNIKREKRSPTTVEATRKKKKRKSRETTSFEVQEHNEETSEIDTDQDSRRNVGTKQTKNISGQSKDGGGKRKKRAKRGKKSGISSTPSEHDDKVDVYKEYPLLLPRSSWSTTQRINLYSKLDVISVIKNTLNERQLKKFKKSCFGDFLDLKITKFSSQLFYHLVRRQCCSTNRNELWFNLEGRIHKFGMKEFSLITGLNCGELPEIDMSKIQKGKFNKRYFGGEKTIKRTKLHEVFTEMDKGRNKDVVKMAKLYILEMFILGKQIRTGINHEYTLLVDDKEQFDRYPWGRISYEITIDFVKKAIKSNDASAIGIGGCAFALLVWAYETIPLLGLNSNFVATRVSFGTPRMNNWAADVHPEWKDLSEKVFQSDSFDVQPLIATKTEMEMPYMIPFGGVKPSEEKIKSQLDQEHNSDARTSYNKGYCNWKGPPSVPNDGVGNFLFTKIVNIEEILGSLVHDIDNLKNLFSKLCENVNEATDPEKMRK